MSEKVRNIVGIVPAAGKSLRFGSLCKELLPVFVDKNNLILASDCTINSMFDGGANSICIVINEEKTEVLKHYCKTEHINHISFFIQTANERVPYGLPVALDIPYEFVKEDTVFFGMPDTICSPRSYFTEMRTFFEREDLELLLGIFPIDDSRQVGPVKIGSVGEVIEIYDKNPNIAIRNTWGAAVWGPKFTKILHDFIIKSKSLEIKEELILKSVFDLALVHNLKVKGYFFEDGTYFDLADFDKYRHMLNAYK